MKYTPSAINSAFFPRRRYRVGLLLYLAFAGCYSQPKKKDPYVKPVEAHATVLSVDPGMHFMQLRIKHDNFPGWYDDRSQFFRNGDAVPATAIQPGDEIDLHGVRANYEMYLSVVTVTRRSKF